MAASKQIISKPSVKCVFIGDACVGKSCLMYIYVNGMFPDVYVPSVFDNYVKELTTDNIPVAFELYDNSGLEDYDRLRPLCFPNTDIFLICFSVDSPHSLDNVYKKWIKYVRGYCPQTPIFLACLKNELRGNADTIKWYGKEYDTEAGKEMAKKIGAIKYFECSAYNKQSYNEMFEEMVRFSLQQKGLLSKKSNTDQKRCIII